MRVVHNDLQLVIAFALFLLLTVLPMALVLRAWRRPSMLQRRPWRMAGALLVTALIAPIAGYALTVMLSGVASAFGWALFYGDDGLKALGALIGAAAVLFAAALGMVFAAMVHARRPGTAANDGQHGQP